MTPLRIIHPGEVLHEEFLIPLKLAPEKLAKDIALPETDLVAIIQGSSSVSADIALRLSKYFGNSAKFWLGLQDDYDLEEAFKVKAGLLETIQPISMDAA